ncbi:MAG: peptidoglycan DD-metalloendopeptidase family protein [Bacteroidales bacterium]|nr:peptidoglycan DD-metalloendopeptidase family protein [Bacteroidales bacterium]
MYLKTSFLLIFFTCMQFSFTQVEIILDTNTYIPNTVDSLVLDFNETAKDTVLTIPILPAVQFYTDVWKNENTRSAYLIRKDSTYVLPLENANTGSFVFPCRGKVCSPYGIRGGRMHTGMDIKQNYGDSIRAAWNGVVRMARMGYYGYGGTVVIRHDNGLETMYAHLSRISVLPNQIVKAGDLIGKAGRTGRATTEHLHFETRFLYEYFNPKTIIDFESGKLITDTLIVKNGKFYAKQEINNAAVKELIPLTSVTDTLITQTNAISTDSAHTLTTTNNNPPKVNPNALYKPKYYTVKQGDTLYQIAKKQHTSINKLCEINKIKETGILSIGQKLKLP